MPPTWVPRLFGIRVRTEGSCTVLSVQGELDVVTVSALADAVDGALEADPVYLVFDLGDLDFMDARALGLLATTAKRLGTVELRKPSAMVTRMLQITGLDERVSVA